MKTPGSGSSPASAVSFSAANSQGRRHLPLWKHQVLCPHHHAHDRALYPEIADPPARGQHANSWHTAGPGVNAYTRRQSADSTTPGRAGGKNHRLFCVETLRTWKVRGKLFCQLTFQLFMVHLEQGQLKTSNCFESEQQNWDYVIMFNRHKS